MLYCLNIIMNYPVCQRNPNGLSDNFDFTFHQDMKDKMNFQKLLIERVGLFHSNVMCQMPV
jgi:hypothetical protein